MAVEIVTVPPSEAMIAGAKHDHRTAGGVPLPHPENPPFEKDIWRVRAAIMMLAASIQGLETLPVDIAAAVDAKINALIGATPGYLDTLDEIAASIGDDPDLKANLVALIGQKASSADLATAVNAINTAVALRATLASPALTGNPTAPTAAFGDRDTSIANTAFVQSAAIATSIAYTFRR